MDMPKLNPTKNTESGTMTPEVGAGAHRPSGVVPEVSAARPLRDDRSWRADCQASAEAHRAIADAFARGDEAEISRHAEEHMQAVQQSMIDDLV